jgi:hypothetical protein
MIFFIALCRFISCLISLIILTSDSYQTDRPLWLQLFKTSINALVIFLFYLLLFTSVVGLSILRNYRHISLHKIVVGLFLAVAGCAGNVLSLHVQYLIAFLISFIVAFILRSLNQIAYKNMKKVLKKMAYNGVENLIRGSGYFRLNQMNIDPDANVNDYSDVNNPNYSSNNLSSNTSPSSPMDFLGKNVKGEIISNIRMNDISLTSKERKIRFRKLYNLRSARQKLVDLKRAKIGRFVMYSCLLQYYYFRRLRFFVFFSVLVVHPIRLLILLK